MMSRERCKYKPNLALYPSRKRKGGRGRYSVVLYPVLTMKYMEPAILHKENYLYASVKNEKNYKYTKSKLLFSKHYINPKLKCP